MFPNQQGLRGGVESSAIPPMDFTDTPNCDTVQVLSVMAQPTDRSGRSGSGATPHAAWAPSSKPPTVETMPSPIWRRMVAWSLWGDRGGGWTRAQAQQCPPLSPQACCHRLSLAKLQSNDHHGALNAYTELLRLKPDDHVAGAGRDCKGAQSLRETETRDTESTEGCQLLCPNNSAGSC